MMSEIDEVRYGAFFDELGQIEKAGILTKFAAGPGFFGQLWRGGKQLLTQPTHAIKGIQKAYGRGSLLQEATGGGRLRQFGGGLKEVWKTPQGKAAIVGGLGVAGGLTGAGYMAGRGGGGQQSQNVYVR